MKSSSIVILIILTTMIIQSPVMGKPESMIDYKFDVSREIKGVVLIDDIHENDYAPSSMNKVISDLRNRGFFSVFASNFTSFSEALSKSHYLVLSAPYSDISTQDAQAVVDWFSTGSRNLLIASRGDYNPISFSSMNTILSGVGANSRVQDDNVYTTDPSVFNNWYIRSNNFDINNYASLFTGVDVIDLFSPSSIHAGTGADVLVFAEKEAYQTDKAGTGAPYVYDNTKDGIGGDSIPLIVYEEVGAGIGIDRIVLSGSSLHSDFDYQDSDAQDNLLFGNIMEYFANKTVQSGQDISIMIPDTEAPELFNIFPHPDATLKGTINVTIDVFDFFDITTYEFLVDNTVQSTKPYFVWDTTGFTTGAHTLTINVKDNSGNIGSMNVKYTINQDFTPSLDTKVKVMSYNIKESGLNDEWKDVFREENPDIAILVETGDFDDNNNQLLDQLLSDFNSYFFDEVVYNGYTLQGISNAWNGITILSRFDLLSTEKISSMKLDSGSAYGIPLPFLYAKVQIFNEEVHFLGTHLTCCSDGKEQRNKQMEGALNFLDSLGDVPIIFLGDFNSQSPDDFSDTTKASLGVDPIKMVLDNTHAKGSEKHYFTDVSKKFHNTPDFTYGSTSRIDYIFVNQYFTNNLIESTTGDTKSALLGSDHVSLDVVIDFSKPLEAVLPSAVDTPSSNSNKTSLNGFNFLLVLLPYIVMRRRKKCEN